LGTYSRDRLFSLVSRYLFTYADLDRAVATLSGGELNRLQLARAELIGATFLILDEPTNHLDITSREVVEEALVEFPGTILVVSHDRYFLDTVAQRVLFYDDGTLGDFPGSFSEYWYEIGRNQYVRNQPPAKRNDESRHTDVEERLLTMEAEKVQLERCLSTAYGKDDLKNAARISERLQKLSRRYDKLYAEWK